MMRCFHMLAVVAAVVQVAAGAEAVNEAAKAFEDLFGDEARKAAATRATSDDAQLAARLVQTAGAVADRKALQVLLCRKAIELGIHDPAGRKTAELAVEKLTELEPDRQAEWQEMLLEIHELGFKFADAKTKADAAQVLMDQLTVVADGALAAGEAGKAAGLYSRALALATGLRSPVQQEISESLADARSKLAAERTCKDLQARLERNAADKLSREALVRAYLLDFDNPAQAARFISDELPEDLRKWVPLAAKPPAESAPPAALDLARWYETLAEDADRARKVTALQRAGEWYQHHLAAGCADDLERVKVSLAIKKVEQELLKAGGLKYGLLRKLVLDLGGGATMRLALIPPGIFLMGCPKGDCGGTVRATPQHRVKISRPYYVGVTEVTQKQYEAVTGKNPSKITGAERPVEYVSWYEAGAFCEKVAARAGRTVRLPTEAEWEYACRARRNRDFCYGDDEGTLAAYAWYKANGGGGTRDVATRRPNAFGLYDMHGNVYEWCQDNFRTGYAKADAVDPTGPPEGSERALRGGSFWYDAGWCRCAARMGYEPDKRWSNVGFRVVVIPPGR